MRLFTKYCAVFVISLGSITACTPDEPEVTYASTYPVSGEWWVTYQVESAPGVYEDVGHGYSKLLTFNTSADDGDSVWVSDEENFWEFKIKAAVDMETYEFSTEESANAFYDSKVIVQNGKVLLKEGRSTSGVVTDSIYFEVSFDDDTPAYGTTYIVSGVRRTGFLEDEH
ncbi:MAG TPA: lipid-binding protein [Ohtaekwangia sp.]|nr:lipid-binding protein [Ohtaekwangia sp.]